MWLNETARCSKHPRRGFAFGDSSLDHELLCWVEKPVLRGRVSHALNSEVYKRFLKEGIEIPFTQRDVNIKPALVPAESSRIKKDGD